MDNHTTEQRRLNMSRVKGKDTKPEMLLRHLLWSAGYRYFLHRKDLPGKPDLVFPGRRKIIFIHGCFWHKHDCKSFSWPQSNADFWREKIEKNVERDLRNQKALCTLGWSWLVIWECQIRVRSSEGLLLKLQRFLDSG